MKAVLTAGHVADGMYKYFNEKTGCAFVIMANTGNIADELASRINSILKNERYPPLELPFIISLYKIISEKELIM